MHHYLRTGLSLLFLISLTEGGAQTIVTGTLTAKSGEGIPVATVKVLATDSSFVTGVSTDEQGGFRLNLENEKKFILVSSSISFRSKYRSIETSGRAISLGRIILREDARTLSEVEVKTIQNRGEQKGDTTQYNADAYKTNPDANAEDLIKKMPGITSDNEGVKVNGEKVQKVLVDGKPFFGDDPNAALKNLPAEVIDKVEVFDRQSEQAQFTGFDDGEEQKTINIVTRKGKNTGKFGRVYGGASADESPELRYNSGAAVNSFTDKRRVTLLLLSNNVNQQNFSTADVTGALGTSGQSGYRAARANAALMNTPQNGISTTHAAGLNYSDTWGKKAEVSGSYFFNQGENLNNSSIVRNYFSENNQVYRQENKDRNLNLNHRVNLRFDYDIDSANRLLVIPSLSFQDNSARSQLNGSNTILDQVLLSRTSTDSRNDNRGYTFSNTLLYQHKLKKKGRTISLRIRNNLSEKDNDGSYSSFNEYGDSSSTGLDQQFRTLSNSRHVSANLSYTEPLTKYARLQFSFLPSYTEGSSDKKTNDYDPLENEYSDFNSALSNQYSNVYTTQRAGLSYRYTKEKLNVSLGADAQEARLEGDQTFPVTFAISQNFKNVLPTARLNYKISKSKNLRINYRTSTDIPDVSQLQDVVDISNPLQVRAGNPGLKQTFSHNLFMRYGGFNKKTSRNAMFFLRGNITRDNISNATYILRSDTIIQGFLIKEGSQVTRPLNLDGFYSASSYFVYGFPVPAFKSNLNLNAGVNFNRNPALINNILNYSNSYAGNAGIFIGSNISENLDFSVGYTANYTVVKNSVQQQSDNTFFSQTTSVKLNWIIKSRLVLNSDFGHTLFKGLTQSFNQDFLLWNGGIGYKFLKNKSLEARISVFDILNQNRSIGRTVNGAYTEDFNTTVLRRYALLTLTYTFRKFGPGATPNNNTPENRQGEGHREHH